MRTHSLFFLAALGLLGFPALSPAESLKVATIDMRKAFDAYGKTVDSERRIEEMRASTKKELGERMDVYKRTVDETNRLTAELDRPELSAASRAEKLKQRDEKVARIKVLDAEGREFEITRTRQLNESMKRIRDGILAEIDKVVQARIQKGDFDLVFDRSGKSLNDIPVVVYARESWDITDEIITELNKAKAPPAPAATPAPPSGKKK